MVRLIRITADDAGDLHANQFKRFKLSMSEPVRLLTNAGLEVL
jgi:hypothetical protein